MFVRTGLRYYGRPCDMSNGRGSGNQLAMNQIGKGQNSRRVGRTRKTATGPLRAGGGEIRRKLLQEYDGGKGACSQHQNQRRQQGGNTEESEVVHGIPRNIWLVNDTSTANPGSQGDHATVLSRVPMWSMLTRTPGCLAIMRAKVIGVMKMRDEKGEDDKLIAVHADDARTTLFLDLDPAPGGAVGQLVRHAADASRLVMVSASVGEWLAQIAATRYGVTVTVPTDARQLFDSSASGTFSVSSAHASR